MFVFWGPTCNFWSLQLGTWSDHYCKRWSQAEMSTVDLSNLAWAHATMECRSLGSAVGRLVFVDSKLGSGGNTRPLLKAMF